ncbi:MAG: hypothetical protein ACO38Q_08205 [Aquiluna sp.]
MSNVKNWLADYSTIHDEVWMALEQAITKLKELNDLMYGEDGELIARAPRVDVLLLTDKHKELTAEIRCYENSKEPSNLPPVLPGEVRFVR